MIQEFQLLREFLVLMMIMINERKIMTHDQTETTEETVIPIPIHIHSNLKELGAERDRIATELTRFIKKMKLVKAKTWDVISDVIPETHEGCWTFDDEKMVVRKKPEENNGPDIDMLRNLLRG